jgi:CRP/FNR family cyclic AMP-dependent transcriptional regulator
LRGQHGPVQARTVVADDGQVHAAFEAERRQAASERAHFVAHLRPGPGLPDAEVFFAKRESVTFTGVPPGGWFGEGSVLKNEILKYDAMALRDSRIARMPAATFLWLLDSSLPFTRFLLMQLNERLGQFIGMVENDRLLNPDTRVARCLASMFNSHLYPGLEKLIQISQEELGFLSGASRQRANQALQLLEKQGLLSLDYGGIRILDLEGLRRYEA